MPKSYRKIKKDSRMPSCFVHWMDSLFKENVW